MKRLNWAKINTVMISLNTLLLVLIFLVLCQDKEVIHHYHETQVETTDTLKYFYSKASWYGENFHGRVTANGETYNMNDLTAASPYLPFNTRLRVVNQLNGKSVTVRVNDRGPFACKVVDNKVIPLYPLKGHPTRSIDLSRAAMKRLAGIDQGVIPVRISII